MTTSSTHSPPGFVGHNIIYLAPRRRLRQCVGNLLDLAASREYTIGGMLRLLADAVTTFGDDLIAEILRAMQREEGDALSGVALLRIIASPAAHTALWRIAQDARWAGDVQSEAYWALYRLGEPVAPGKLNVQEARPSRCDRES